MGPQRDGVWREKNILGKFPDNGPVVLWRTNVNRGYCGPAVVGNRLFMMDRQAGAPFQRKPGDKSIPAAGNERVLCLDADSAKQALGIRLRLPVSRRLSFRTPGNPDGNRRTGLYARRNG